MKLSQTQSERIAVDEFIRTPYLNVLTYPQAGPCDREERG